MLYIQTGLEDVSRQQWNLLRWKRNLHRDKNIVVATIREQCQQGQIDRRGVINWISYDEEEEIHVKREKYGPEVKVGPF